MLGCHESGRARLPSDRYPAPQGVTSKAWIHHHKSTVVATLYVSRTQVAVDHVTAMEFAETRGHISTQSDELVGWPLRAAVTKVLPVEELL